MLRKLLVELIFSAYKRGRDDEAKKADADYKELLDMADEVIGIAK